MVSTIAKIFTSKIVICRANVLTCKRFPHHWPFVRGIDPVTNRMDRASADPVMINTVYPKKYAHGFCFAVLCCGYTLTDFPISIRLTSLALWQSNDCPSASKATPMNMDKYFMWIHYERLHNHNKAKHSKTVCIFLGIYCMFGNNSARVTENWSWNKKKVISFFRRWYLPCTTKWIIFQSQCFGCLNLYRLCHCLD